MDNYIEQILYENVINALEYPSEIRLDSNGMMECVIKKNGQCFMPDFENLLIIKRFENNKWFEEELLEAEYIVIKAPPILMALCLGRSDLVKYLIDTAYPAKEKLKYIELCGSLEYKFGNHDTIVADISVGEYIFFDNNISDDIKLNILRHMLINKRLKSKNQKKSIDETWLNLIEKNHSFYTYFYERKYIEEFIKTFKMIYTRKPRYIRNMITKKQYCEFISCFDIKIQSEFWLYVLENIVKSESQRYRLFKIILLNMNKTLVIEDEKSNYISEIFGIVTKFYRKADKYYKESEKLQRVFLCAVIRNYFRLRQILYHNNDMSYHCSDELFCDSFENGIKMLIRKNTPNDCSFKEFARIVLNALSSLSPRGYGVFVSDIEEISESIFIMQLYKKICGGEIIIDSSFIFSVYLWNSYPCKIIDSDKILITIDRELAEYLSLADRYCFDDRLPLNELQKQILYEEETVVISEMKKDVYRGNHVSEAIEYAYTADKYDLIPCIVAFGANDLCNTPE